MKNHVLTLSDYFPAWHSRKGYPTNFKEQFLDGDKIHTIRKSHKWIERIQEVQNGDAKLSIRRWTGKPYNSKQEVIKELYGKKVGVQKVSMRNGEITSIYYNNIHKQSEYFDMEVAVNDGLNIDDFQEWFAGVTGELVIIHFTEFRY